MKLRSLSLLLLLGAGVAQADEPQADEPMMGAYAGASIGRATQYRVEFFKRDYDADATAYKVLFGYRILKGLALEANYTDYGEVDERVRGRRIVGDIDSIGASVVGLIPLNHVDLFGKVGFAAWDGTVNVAADGRRLTDNDIDPTLGIGAQYRSGHFAARAEVELMTLSFGADDEIDYDNDGNWVDFISVGFSWTF